VAYPGTTWQERSVVALVDYDFSEIGYASTTLQVDPALGAVVQRVHDGLWRYAFTEPLAQAENGLAGRIERVLGQVAPEAEDNVVSLTAGRMHERTADSYRVRRVLLAGDAAHATNLLSGAGPVAGLLDSEALVSALSEEAAEAALDGYAEVRRRDFLDRVLPASSDLKHLITQISDPRRLDTELESYRDAVHDLDAQRELLLFGQAPASFTYNGSQRGTS
jgi:2-polyprenyl-6-methoxyphenol hydroxylase-like FAD-dependent oxidoreductase